LLASPIFSLRGAINWPAVAKVAAASAVVPIIEETFFRGLVLGVLLKSGRRYMSIFVTSALYSIVHFLKAPERTSEHVTWISGFNSIAHAFVQFTDPVLVAAGFTTLFLIGWILADARLQTRSLWLPIGLHAGWIFTSGAFNKMARHDLIVLPWLGKNLMVGIVPLGVACLTWLIMRGWLKYVGARST
jgi:membrane protease YdiL (CAAX protease family)